MPKWCLRAVLLALIVGLPAPGLAQEEAGGASPEALVTQAGTRYPGTSGATGLLEVLGSAGESPERMGAAIGSGLLGAQSAGNTAVIEQIGFAHRTAVVQLGSRNGVALRQVGSANRVDALQQGDSNVFGARLYGSDNHLTLVQDGDDNLYFLDFRGSSLRHRIVQQGSANRLVQVGVGNRPISVVQQGTGMEVRIEHAPMMIVR